jgi:hypothetical protein
MKRPWFVPSPIAVLSGVLLFGLAIALGWVAALVVPHLIELMKTDPRLAMIGLAALVLSPGLAVVLAHHVGHGALDRFDPAGTPARHGERGLLPSPQSWWAGAFAWLALHGTSILTRLALLVLYPPPPRPDAAPMYTLVDAAVFHLSVAAPSANVALVVWIAIASELYELERRANRRRNRRGGDFSDADR